MCSTPGGPLSIALATLDRTIPDDVVDMFWTAFQLVLAAAAKELPEEVTIEGLLK